MSEPAETGAPKKTAPLLDIHAFLEVQRHERYRAFIIHSAPGKGKTTFARQLATATGGTCIDVLAKVAATPTLANQVDLLFRSWRNPFR